MYPHNIKDSRQGRLLILPQRGFLPQQSRNSGFALIIALSLMSFVLLLLLSMATLVRVESGSATAGRAELEAQQAAILGLNIAIGELQKATGPDQRVTAAAELISDNNSQNLYTNGGLDIPFAQSRWLGIWKSDTVSSGTPSYTPENPDARQFVSWLVSTSNNNDGSLELPTVLGAVSNDITGLNNTVTLSSDSTGTPTFQAEKIAVTNESTHDCYYAFAVEDESIKADLSWSEMDASSIILPEAARLSVVPGPDLSVLGNATTVNPFSKVTYPLTSNGSGMIQDEVLKYTSLMSPTFSLPTSNHALDWYKDSSAFVTWGSFGVLSDVKWGGLRRDLSLAFEMDDASESYNATNFNEQYGEFTGNRPVEDQFTSPYLMSGIGKYARYLYRYNLQSVNSQLPFSGDLAPGATNEVAMRGPNWWSLRDYANLYKRLSGNTGNYSLNSRVIFPNITTEGSHYFDRFTSNFGSQFAAHWDKEVRNGNYIFKPAQPSYAPICLGACVLISLQVDSVGELLVGADPVYYIWNPYNRSLNFDSLKLNMDKNFPGRINYQITTTDSDGNSQTGGLEGITLSTLFGGANSSNNTVDVLDTSGPLVTMEPGEILIVTPANTGSGVANIGYFEQGLNNSGFIEPTGEILDLSTDIEFGYGMDNSVGSSRFYIYTLLDQSGQDVEYTQSHMQIGMTNPGFTSLKKDGILNMPKLAVSSLVGQKRFVGAFIHLMAPANFYGDAYGGSLPNDPVEIFGRFNPAPLMTNKDFFTSAVPNQIFACISDVDPQNLLNNYGINFSGLSGRNGYWGESYSSFSGGSTAVPMSNIPDKPLLSIAEFSHANVSLMACEPFHIIGNSWSSPVVPVQTIFGSPRVTGSLSTTYTAADHSWLMNDALFDRYYFSGAAPDFNIGSNGYTPTGTLAATLQNFYTVSSNSLISPVLSPHVPDGLDSQTIVNDLTSTDGYMKAAAYSLIRGPFNVNSTSVDAWTAFLSGNKDLTVQLANGNSENSNGVPFPSSSSPIEVNGAQLHWSGFSRLDDSDISRLASNIVEQVRLRGPFMSLSDFVNRRVGGNVRNDTHYSGALQTAIDQSGINTNTQTNAGGVSPVYSLSSNNRMTGEPVTTSLSTTGIPADITQASLLRPLAPRLTARADTFKVRAYGEAASNLGGGTVAICEAIVQRLPEYVDSIDSPWAEATDPLSPINSTLTALNQQFGRKYKIVSFRWLSKEEI